MKDHTYNYHVISATIVGGGRVGALTGLINIKIVYSNLNGKESSSTRYGDFVLGSIETGHVVQ